MGVWVCLVIEIKTVECILIKPRTIEQKNTAKDVQFKQVLNAIYVKYSSNI